MNKKMLAERLREFADMRKQSKMLSKDIDESQALLVEQLQATDPDKNGFPINDEGDVAYWQQNKPSTSWDVEKIMEWLNKADNKKLRMKVTSRVFDSQKWEAEIQAGNISTKKANKFLSVGKQSKPFVRFGKK